MYYRRVPKNLLDDIKSCLEANDVAYIWDFDEIYKDCVVLKFMDSEYEVARPLITHFTGEPTVVHRVWKVL